MIWRANLVSNPNGLSIDKVIDMALGDNLFQ